MILSLAPDRVFSHRAGMTTSTKRPAGANAYRIDPEFAACIPPPNEDERAALSALIKRGAAVDPGITWRGLLIDGHTRAAVCEELGVPFATVETQLDLADRNAVKAWMIAHQLARRNWTSSQIAIMCRRANVDPPGHIRCSAEWQDSAEIIVRAPDAMIRKMISDPLYTCRIAVNTLRRSRGANKPSRKGPRQVSTGPKPLIAPSGKATMAGLALTRDAVGVLRPLAEAYLRQGLPPAAVEALLERAAHDVVAAWRA